jgi:hypothetical protein
MDELIKEIDKRIKETNKSIAFYKNKINDLCRVYEPSWIKLHTNNYSFYHGLLGELAILIEIKSKINKEYYG